MQTTRIPQTDLNPSTLCLGSADFGAGVPEEMAFALLDGFVEAGGTFVDTAKVYNDWVPGETSRSEKMIGRWLMARHNRDEIILATKGAHFNLQTPHIPRLAPSDIRQDIIDSLRNLQTGWIDLYWLHRDDPSRPVEEILQALHQAQSDGLIRWYGASNWGLERLLEARNAAQANGWSGFCAVQNLWNLAGLNENGIADPTVVAMDGPIWAFHHHHGIAAVPFSSQANGLFQKLAEGASLKDLPEGLRRMYGNPINEKRLARIRTLQQQSGLSVTQIVLGYLLSQPFPTLPIFSARSLDQLRDSLQADGTHLTAQQIDFLTADDDKP